MQYKVKTFEFQKAITSVEGVISSREIKSILSNLKLETTDDSLYISATDMEISIRTKISADIIQKGTTCLPAKQLSSMIKTVKFPMSLIKTDLNESNHPTEINDADEKEDSQFYLNGIESEEIKTIPPIPSNVLFDIPVHMLREMIRKTEYSVSQDGGKFAFNGLLIKSNENKLTMVGSDGRRLSKIERTIPTNLNLEKGILVPHKAVREIQKMMDSTELAKIGLLEDQFYVSIGNIELLTKLIDGSFPDYNQIFPKNVQYVVQLPKDELSDIVKQAIVSAEEPTKQIKFNFTKNNLEITSSSPGTMGYKRNLTYNYSGEDLSMGFKGDYLSDLLKVIDDAEVLIEINSSNAPVVFRDPSDPDFVSIIMPMKG